MGLRAISLLAVASICLIGCKPTDSSFNPATPAPPPLPAPNQPVEPNVVEPVRDTHEFDAFEGCWVNDVNNVLDEFCITRGTNSVSVSWENRNTQIRCNGRGVMSHVTGGGFIIRQPETIGGCINGNAFVAQEFECYPVVSTQLSCTNRFNNTSIELLFVRDWSRLQ